MNLDNFANILATIVVLAGVTVVITSPQTAGVIRAFGQSFSDSIKAATAR